MASRLSRVGRADERSHHTPRSSCDLINGREKSCSRFPPWATLTPRRRIAVNLRATLAANAAHYERQITETYKTEELLHGLWKQKQMKERGVVLGTFRERQQDRLRAEREIGSTYLLGKDAARRAAARLAAELAEAEPRFADVDALRDFGRFARDSTLLEIGGVPISLNLLATAC